MGLSLPRQQQDRPTIAMQIQGLKAIRQALADGGTWEVAWSFLPFADPTGEETFAGEEGELETIASYSKAKSTLRKGMRQARDGDDSSSDSSAGGDPLKPKKKKKNKKRGKKKKHDKAQPTGEKPEIPSPAAPK